MREANASLRIRILTSLETYVLDVESYTYKILHTVRRSKYMLTPATHFFTYTLQRFRLLFAAFTTFTLFLILTNEKLQSPFSDAPFPKTTPNAKRIASWPSTCDDLNTVRRHLILLYEACAFPLLYSSHFLIPPWSSTANRLTGTPTLLTSEFS
jgi:hypothetical protein